VEVALLSIEDLIATKQLAGRPKALEDVRGLLRTPRGVDRDRIDEGVAPNPHQGHPILTNKRAITLGTAATRIRTLFPADKPLDIEWFFVGDDLHIVQARPYVVK
jgi:hypothetical protein